MTHVLPPIRPVGFPIYVARRPGGSIHSLLPRSFTFYLGNPISSILKILFVLSKHPYDLCNPWSFCLRSGWCSFVSIRDDARHIELKVYIKLTNKC